MIFLVSIIIGKEGKNDTSMITIGRIIAIASNNELFMMMTGKKISRGVVGYKLHSSIRSYSVISSFTPVKYGERKTMLNFPS